MNNFHRQDSELLRFSVIGSVDDGKSTLIGRLLFDSKSILQDQLDAIESASRKRGDDLVNLALLTDGLKAEREQGITIDVAYRYFASEKRKFIISDCPGHIQYTKNMVTGISNSNLAIVLIDARNGVVEQTKRHTFIADLMGIKHLAVCINKMDLVNYSEDIFEEIKNTYKDFISKLQFPDVRLFPICATEGDNIVKTSENMPWYRGTSLMHYLETVHLGADHNFIDARFPIQRVIRPQAKEHPDYRAFAGRVEGGVFKPNDEVLLLPSGFKAQIEKIQSFDEPTIEEAFYPMSVSISLKEEFDISRGDMIVKVNRPPESSQEISLMICWFSEKKLVPGGKYLIKHTTNETRGIIKDIQYKVDIKTLHRAKEDFNIGLNDIAKITLRTSKQLHIDKYTHNKSTGSVIIIDEQTNETVGAGMII